MSVPVNRLKLLAVGVGAAVAALAGTINAALLQGAFPDDYNTQVLIIIYAMVILGGAGSLAGAVLGAIVVSVFMLEGLRPQTPIGDLTGNGRWIFYGAILLVLVVAIRPWRRLAAILGGIVAFGVVVHAIVAATTERGTDGLLNTAPETFEDGGPLGWLDSPLACASGWDVRDRLSHVVQRRSRRPDRPGPVHDAREGLEA